MSKFLQHLLVCLAVVSLPLSINADDFQVANSDFEDWSGATFDGKIQPANWNASNVTQFGFKFNFAHQETGHNGGYCMMVQDQDVGAAGISETSPGYFSLGTPWVYIKSLTEVSSASAGTYGGISWTHRPDSMSVWIKRTGSDAAKEDFYLLYYSWAGTAKASSYMGKNEKCTSTSTYTDEESDIRRALDKNACTTSTLADPGQIAEGMWRERATYNAWTNIRVPIYYMNDYTPQKMNIIFSASNYPNFRANSGLYAGNSLYIDDIEMIYSSKIQKLYINDVEWKGFDPNSTEVQVYSLGESATAIPDKIEAKRGAGSLTNARGDVATFSGRTLSGSEITIVKGDLSSTPTTITVKSEDGKSTTVYKIQFQKAASSNAKLAGITVNGEPLTGFSPTKYNYNVDLPYGTTTAPVVAAEGQEDQQTVEITQANSVEGTATIKVTAANGKATQTYTLVFKVGLLADNELQDILVNGKSIPGFTPSQTIYRVSLPVTTTVMPTITPVSKYNEGEQTIVHNVPSVIDGGTYQLSVTTPGNQIAKTYKLNFKLEKSSYTYLKDLKVGGETVKGFAPDNFTYYINLPLGTMAIPAVTYTEGDEFQTITESKLGDGVLDGTYRVTVTAGNGDQSVYKLVFSTEKSDKSTLNGIQIGGVDIPDFDPDVTSYSYILPVGTTVLPEITPILGDEFQKVSVTTAGINGKTRITVTAGDGSTTIYLIAFSVETFSDNTLADLTVAGFDIAFDPETTDYYVNLPQGTTALPEVSYTLKNETFQTASVRAISGLTGDYKITVRPQSGASRTYTIHFTLATSNNVNLSMIYVGGVQLEGFAANDTVYEVTLPEGVSKIPAVTFDKAESTQRVLSVLEGKVQKITVTAQSGDTRTYTINFIITVSENAYLEMIYLGEDSVPLAGFAPDNFNYEVMLEGSTCPLITVKKAAGQQVTITAPYGAGEAQIKVQPEQGSANIYIINFKAGAAATARLKGILIDGDTLAEFSPTVLTYSYNYSGSLPVVEGVAADASQKVQVLWKGEVASIHVTDAEGNKAVYSIVFTRQLLGNNTLTAILINGAPLDKFKPEVLNYDSILAAGSTYPEVNYIADEKADVVFFGQVAEGKWGISVVAEDGTVATYTIKFTISKYTDATLKNIFLDGVAIADFASDKLNYEQTIEEGARLPQLSVEAREGQTIIQTNLDDTHQQVIVYAENGATNTYLVTYTRQQSSNALLADILIDGVSLEGFDPNTTDYVVSIPWRSKFVPNVFPVGKLSNQTITTYFSRPNGVTRIHVVAQDGETTKDYTISFPVRKSDNTKLEDLYLASEDAEIIFKADQTDYEVILPYSATACPPMMIEKGEPEQRIDLISRPIGETSQIIVIAENGDTRTYNILFKREVLKKANLLQSIYIKEIDKNLSLKDKTVRDFDVTLPYGARSLTVEYEKSYEEQTVFVYPGGVQETTFIVVKANNDTVADEIYKIHPIQTTQNPAVLNSIKVDGVDVPNFDPNRFTYVVNRSVSTYPKMTVTRNSGVEYEPETSLQKWEATVSKDGYTNVYKVFFHYTNDVIPNGEFTEWTQTSKSNSDKPTSWNAPGDCFNKYAGTVKASESVKKESASIVHLSNFNWLALAGELPSVINLGQLDCSPAVAGQSTTTPSGFISYHNTPDVAKINYKYTNKAGNGALFRFKFFDVEGEEHVVDHTQTSTKSSYADYFLNLSTDGLGVSGMDIIIDASGKYPDGAYNADLFVDYIRFSYNSTPKYAKINDINATLSGKVFTTTLIDPEDVNIRSYEFNGEVSDQAQLLNWGDWSEDGDYSVRTATIRNFAEDGTYTDGYSLVVKRPLDTRNQLDSILVNGARLASFVADKEDYTISLPLNTQMPDIMPVPGSSRQKVTTSYNDADSTMTISVRPEKGDVKVYTIKFKSIVSNDTTLASIVAEGLTFDPEQKNYELTAEQWPIISFVKKSDSQVVTLQNGVISVTAEDGVSTGIYTITRVNPTITPSGIIKEFSRGENVISEFGEENYTREEAKPAEVISFIRQQDADSVIFVQSTDGMEWFVPGTNKAYTWTYQTELSDNAKLAQILLDNAAYGEFDPNFAEYEIYSDTTLLINAVAADDNQSIVMTQDVVSEGVVEGVEYTIVVTAENGSANKTYKVRVLRPLSSDATLAGIMLDSILIDGFDPAQEHYTVTLPTPAVKKAQPQMPSVTYIAGHKGQMIEVTPGELNGAKTEFSVTSEDGMDTKYYDLTIKAEPSHCVDLTGITVNGEAIQGDVDEEFEPGRHFYSLSLKTSKIEVDYTSDDRFQTVTISSTELEKDSKYRYILHVVAEDGVTSTDYQVNVYVENKSNDATLANILLDGKKLVDFERALNEKLAFDPGKNYYDVNLPSGTTVWPEVSAQLKMDGQKVDISQQGDSVLLTVTAANDSTNTYVLHFIVPLSKNADLSMIFLNGDSLDGFDPTYYFYQVDLPVGTHELPEVVAQKAEVSQTILPIVVDNNKLQATIKVQAEDPTTRENTYVVVFHFTQSDADTLNMIYQDGKALENFEPKNMYYALSLPVGTDAFPELGWDEADDWQTIKMDTVESTSDKLIRQILVTSESGKKSTYTVSYTILKSAIDTLQMLFIDQKQLAEFKADQLEYNYELSASYAAELNGKVPTVEYISGDEYQTVLVSQVPDSLAGKSLGYKSIVTVTAATGKTRTYTIHYPVQKSSEATLNMINLAGEPLANYDAERFNYKVEIEMEASVPVVSVLKKEDVQVYEIHVIKDTVRVEVWAEDGTQAVYTLVFARVMSAITSLRDIVLTDENSEQISYPFRPETYSYTIGIPYSAEKPLEEQLPNIEPIEYDPQQSTDTVHHILSNGDIQVDITVTAPNGEDQTIYSLTFHFLKPTDATLTNIFINNEALANFSPTETDYTYVHPYGSTTDDYFTVDSVAALISDPLATMTITSNEEGTIFIRVVAQDGTTEVTYTITQTIGLDNDCWLSAILLDGDTIRGFDSDITFYTYYLRAGSTTTPSVDAIPHSENAEVSIKDVSAGDTCLIVCTADDGTMKRYYVHFAVSTINEALVPTANDVVIKRIAGTNQIFVGTIRSEVYFALYDQSGRQVFYKKVPTADPNDIEMVDDIVTKERLNNIIDERSGLIIDVIPGQVYFYSFYYGYKTLVQMMRGDTSKKLKSGKFIALPY